MCHLVKRGSPQSDPSFQIPGKWQQLDTDVIWSKACLMHTRNRLLLQSWAQLQSSPPPQKKKQKKNCLVYAYRFKTQWIQYQALAHFFLHLSSYLLHLCSFYGGFFLIGFAKSSVGSRDCRTLIMQWSTSV